MQLLRNPHVTAVTDAPTAAAAAAPTMPKASAGAASANPAPAGPVRPATPTELHRLIDGYAPTPLVPLVDVARRLGVAQVLVKHEAQRFGLPAFKIIGASWATYRVLLARYVEQQADQHAQQHAQQQAGGHAAGPAFTTFDEIRRAFATLGDITLVTATDGNHGRAVARAARWFGLRSRIFMPAGTVDARVEAIESEGATVTVVDGDYDLAVHLAAAEAGPDTVVISDTSWPGYTDVPTWIAEGYSTIFEEIDRQLVDLGLDADAVVVPVGVGALAQAALDHWPAAPPAGPVRIAVEPTAADCLYRSLVAGEPVTVPGPHPSMMAGMNCGTLSMIAWPTMRDRFDWCVTIEDEAAADAMRLLADAGLVVGETGAAALGALLAVAASPDGLAALGLGPGSTVVCICTEGATDPANYAAVVGRTPEEVAS